MGNGWTAGGATREDGSLSSLCCTGETEKGADKLDLHVRMIACEGHYNDPQTAVVGSRSSPWRADLCS